MRLHLGHLNPFIKSIDISELQVKNEKKNTQFCGTEVLAALGEVTTTLSKIVDWLDRQESQLKSLEEKISSPSSSTEGKETLKF